MAQRTIQLDQEKLRCSICLDLLKDPVTIPCGHSYCMSCIQDYWDEGNPRKTHSCPQCRQRFAPRPVLVKNTMFAELVEELKKGLGAASTDWCYAGPGHVGCDFCTERKLKAVKSCLVCMASYCEHHLRPHYTVAPLKKHKLVEATLKLEENFCSRHDEVMKIFCRTDQRCICYLCSIDEHKGHNTVSAAAERAERQLELGGSRQKIRQQILNLEKAVNALRREVKAINRSADKAVRDSEDMFSELILLLKKRSSEVTQKIRSQQKRVLSRTEELQQTFQEEISELRQRDGKLAQLANTEDHLHFLKNYPLLSQMSESTDLPSMRPLKFFFESVSTAVLKVPHKLQAVLTEEWPNISKIVAKVDVLLAQDEPKTRAEFLRYSCKIALNPNTAHAYLSLCKNNRKATLMADKQSYVGHPDRFLKQWQVLSRKGLTGRCYWEVEWRGIVAIALAYGDISKTGSREQCGFGLNEKSWALMCNSRGYNFRHSKTITAVRGPLSSRVGVYLDHRAGVLSFYSVSNTMTLLHRVETSFTQPLYPGFWLQEAAGDVAEFCELR